MSRRRRFPDELTELPLDADAVQAAGRTFVKVDGRWWAQSQAGTWRPAAWLVRNLGDQLLDHMLADR